MTQAEGYFEKYHHDGILFYHNFLMPLHDTGWFSPGTPVSSTLTQQASNFNYLYHNR
jgi:hypothetical protein